MGLLAVILVVLAAIDFNIILPALFTAIPLTIGAAGGFLLAIHNIRKARHVHEEAVMSAIASVHDEVRTNHGLRAGDYLERIGVLSDWAQEHQIQDNQVRSALGLEPGKVPTWPRQKS